MKRTAQRRAAKPDGENASPREVYKDRRVLISIECSERILHLEPDTFTWTVPLSASTLLHCGRGPYIFSPITARAAERVGCRDGVSGDSAKNAPMIASPGRDGRIFGEI